MNSSIKDTYVKHNLGKLFLNFIFLLVTRYTSRGGSFVYDIQG